LGGRAKLLQHLYLFIIIIIHKKKKKEKVEQVEGEQENFACKKLDTIYLFKLLLSLLFFSSILSPGARGEA
jgi:hypothetical protein